MVQRIIHLMTICFLLMMIFSSCDFQTVVEMDIPDTKPKLVVNGVLTPDSVIFVYVTESQSILDGADFSGAFKAVENATVILTIDNNQIILPSQGNGLYRSEDLRADIGKNYSIRVSASGFETVSSATFIPEPVQITKIDRGAAVVRGQDEPPAMAFDLYFKDAGERVDFYSIIVTTKGTRRNQLGEREDFEYQQIVETNDLALKKDFIDRKNMLLFKDVVFNGREAKISVLIQESSIPNDSTQLYFTLKTLNSDLYYYLESQSLQQYVEGDPFAQPVVVHNNIINGFGIFGAYSRHKVELK